jgi:L-rhamnose mutarotase
MGCGSAADTGTEAQTSAAATEAAMDVHMALRANWIIEDSPSRCLQKIVRGCEYIPMKRFGQLLKLRPEHQADYVRHHAQVWPGVLAQIRRSNIRNYSIYLREGMLFAYFEYVGSDFEADMRAMAADPETQRWWALMEPMQEKWPTAGPAEWWSNLAEVFHTD